MIKKKCMSKFIVKYEKHFVIIKIQIKIECKNMKIYFFTEIHVKFEV